MASDPFEVFMHLLILILAKLMMFFSPTLKSYLKREELEIDDFKCKDWSLKTEIESDFIRSILFLSEKIICSTNLGYLYLIDSNSNSLNIISFPKQILKRI